MAMPALSGANVATTGIQLSDKCMKKIHGFRLNARGKI
jgi:hypothetical protein